MVFSENRSCGNSHEVFVYVGIQAIDFFFYFLLEIGLEIHNFTYFRG